MKEKVEIDHKDALLLEILQADATASLAVMSEKVSLSQNACWRRIKRLEQAGVLVGRVALCDPESLGLGVTVFVSIRTAEHSAEWLEKFARGIQSVPEVVEFYRMSGDVDYLLKVMVRSIEDYDRVYKKLISVVPLFDVTSSFAMERIKSTTALPVTHPGA